MRKHNSILSIGFLTVAFVNISPFAMAEIFCIEDNTQFKSALQAAATNGENDILLIVEGVETGEFVIPYESGKSVQIKSGYTAGCHEQSAKILQSQDQEMEEPGAGDKQKPPPQQNTTGPTPPTDVEPAPEAGGAFLPVTGGASMSMIGVPAYYWRHGCGPTALGMVLGYYDENGFPDLYDGDADTQTEAVNQGIASQGSTAFPQHYEDYSLPNDEYESSPLADKSEAPEGDEHLSNSIADFMETSWSSKGNFYGWSWSTAILPAFNGYTQLRNSKYVRESAEYYKESQYSPTLTWEVLTTEIDNNRPMVFLVDTDADGYTDHFVTVIGYSDSPTLQYASLDTWSSSVRWEEFATIDSGQSWGIWGGWTFKLNLPGDLDDSRSVDLRDAIISLQIVSNKAPISQITLKADVNEDNLLGLEEAIFILSKLSTSQ